MSVTVSPTVSAWVNIIIAVMGVVGASSADLTTVFGTGTTSNIVTIAGAAATILGTVNTVLHGVSSAKAGPLVAK